MNKKPGFSLVELIISMVVLAIIVYASIAIFVNAGVKGINVEIYTTAQSLAESKLEEAMTRLYVDVPALTLEGETDFLGELENYNYQFYVNYVSSEALDQTMGYDTGYTKIRVLVRHSNLVKAVSLEAVKADY